jgi:hypothetical protein
VKIAPIVLLCLVTLSVIYGCSVVWFNYQIQGTKHTSFTEGIDFLKSLGIPSSYLQADPIDSPRPSIKNK